MFRNIVIKNSLIADLIKRKLIIDFDFFRFVLVLFEHQKYVRQKRKENVAKVSL